MVNIKMFRHPQYYKNLRKLARLRNRNQVISSESGTPPNERAPGTGHNQQASSNKLTKSQASSGKHQAPSTKAQA